MKTTKKTWIILLTGMLVIGLIPSMANPKNAQTKNQITVDIPSATSIGGEGNSGDVYGRQNTEIEVHQSLTQPIDIREFQVAGAQKDLDIPVFDDGMIEVER